MRLIIAAFLITSLNCTAQVIENFSMTNVLDGKTITLEGYSSSTGIVIIFTSINCPYDGYYLSRIKELAEKNGKVPVLLVNSSSSESIEQMKRFVEQNSIRIPYLADQERKMFTSLNPRKSPECFLLQNRVGKFNVVYRGAIDDNPQTSSEVNQQYLKNAIENMIANQKIGTPDVRPVGCSIPKN
ncbi:MAG TPA: redoxin domain-containing protein [Cyclobacteriaceae bacterium]|nr:redoxin domain-containing protein [Cyclobacteriaceae bacterium]